MDWQVCVATVVSTSWVDRHTVIQTRHTNGRVDRRTDRKKNKKLNDIRRSCQTISTSFRLWWLSVHYRVSVTKCKHWIHLNVTVRDIKFAIQIGADWHQMRQIYDFLRYVSVRFGSAKLILKSPRFVRFGANLTQFGYQIWHPWRRWPGDRDFFLN